MQKLNKCILKEKQPGKGLMRNFITIVYEGQNLGLISLTDIEGDSMLAFYHGDIAVLPKNQEVIYSIKHGVINYFSKRMNFLGDNPPISVYGFKEII